MPTPDVLGLPSKFSGWRKNQSDAIYRAVYSEKPVVLPVCPTGFGKSLMYVAASKMLGGKTIILTSTKGLQAQLMRDFSEVGMVEVKGKNSYMCPMTDNTLTCEDGPCSVGVRCEFKKSVCPYYRAVEDAKNARLVVTNYSFWFYSNKYAEGIGNPGLLVCDEGHDAPASVAGFLTITIPRRDIEIEAYLPKDPETLTIPKWVGWATGRCTELETSYDDLLEEFENDPAKKEDTRLLKEAATLRRLISQMQQLKAMTTDNWVCDVTPFEVSFAPIDVRGYCSDLLYGRANKVILTSASVNYKTAQMLGLDETNCEMLEYEHTFPVENRMVVHIRGARMNARATGEDLKEWLYAADSIIRDRLDRKGIFHTTSYARRDFVLGQSNYAAYMLSHDKKDLLQKIFQFKNAKPPAVFVSPAVTTGWDFPYDAAEYQIIGKIAYPDTRNKITKARCEADEEYGAYIAMQQLVQTAGRGTRADDDACENFIIDDNITWFMKKYRKFAPKWFLESMTSRIFPPDPPKSYRERLLEEYGIV